MCLTSSAGHSTWMFALEANWPCSNVHRDITFNLYSIQDSSLTASHWRFKTMFFLPLLCVFPSGLSVWRLMNYWRNVHQSPLSAWTSPPSKTATWPQVPRNQMQCITLLRLVFQSWFSVTRLIERPRNLLPSSSHSTAAPSSTAARPPASKGQLQCDFKPGIESWLTFSSTLF